MGHRSLAHELVDESRFPSGALRWRHVRWPQDRPDRLPVAGKLRLDPDSSIDRLILNAYIPTLQMPGAMVTFLREVCGKPILSPVVFKALTDRFVAAVQAFVETHRVPMCSGPPGRTRPSEVAQRALRSAACAPRWGVVAVVVHQGSAGCLTGASHHSSHHRS